MKNFLKTFLFALLLASAVSAQNGDRDRAVALYGQKDYKAAIKLFKKSLKENENDAQGWYYLGISYLNIEEETNALKALQKAAELKPDDAPIKNGLAYAYLFKNDLSSATKEATAAINLNDKMAESYYILGVISFRNGAYNAAYEKAVKTIEINRNIAEAHLLKSECLVASFGKQYNTIAKTAVNRAEILKEAESDLENFLRLSPSLKNIDYYRNYLTSIKFFAGYYKSKNVEPAKPATETPATDPQNLLRITSKPRANYTETARRVRISGTVTLLAGFDADGTIKHVLILNPLGYGLNEESVRAARGIKFKPETENGKPISVVKQLQYSFTIF